VRIPRPGVESRRGASTFGRASASALASCGNYPKGITMSKFLTLVALLVALASIAGAIKGLPWA
jgi:hypothetical protein